MARYYIGDLALVTRYIALETSPWMARYYIRDLASVTMYYIRDLAMGI